MAVEKGTISVQLVGEALLEARRRGLDVAALLERVGLPAQALERPYGRVPSALYGQLFLSRCPHCIEQGRIRGELGVVAGETRSVVGEGPAFACGACSEARRGAKRERCDQ